MKRGLAVAAVCSAVLGSLACGGQSASSTAPAEAGVDGAVDRPDSSEGVFDAGSPDRFDDGPPSPALPGFCDAGLFVEISDDAGTQRLTESCVDSGPPVPTIASYIPGEDCVGKELRACEALASVRLFTGCNECFSGSCSMSATYDDGDGGLYGIPGDGGFGLQWGSAAVDLSARPPDGGIVGGTFTTTFIGIADDAGVAQRKTFAGRFCVLFL